MRELGMAFPPCWILFDAPGRAQRGKLLETSVPAADGKSEPFQGQLELGIWESRAAGCLGMVLICLCHSWISRDSSLLLLPHCRVSEGCSNFGNFLL